MPDFRRGGSNLELLLVPWVQTVGGFALRVYELPYSGYTDDPEPVEITTSRGQEIAIALLDRCQDKRICVFNPKRSLRLAVEINVPEEKGGRLLKALENLANINPKALRERTAKSLAKDLLRNPTLKGLEHFLAITKLLEE